MNERLNRGKNPYEIFDLTDQVGIIFGGYGKMGRQFAEVLTAAGADIVLADKEIGNCKDWELCQIDAEQNISSYIVSCDVSNPQKIKNTFENVFKKFGRIDFMIYNVMAKPNDYYDNIDEYKLNTWNEVLNANLSGAFLCCREARKYFRKMNKGAIVITSSIYGLVGPDMALYESCKKDKNIYGNSKKLNCPASYSASKAGLIGLTKNLATTWAKENIRVNILIPGGVYDGQEEAFHNEYIRRTPMKRMAEWSDFNGAILFLVSQASKYMTGAELVIDGGWTAW